jgi:hypothetical protein
VLLQPKVAVGAEGATAHARTRATNGVQRRNPQLAKRRLLIHLAARRCTSSTVRLPICGTPRWTPGAEHPIATLSSLQA